LDVAGNFKCCSLDHTKHNPNQFETIVKASIQSIARILSLAAISAAPLHAQEMATPNLESAKRGLAALRAERANTSRATAPAKKDIVDTAVAAGSFKTLAAALTAAGLVETLKGEGPFTVFAPTDEAFAKLPAGTVENLLKPENKARLTAILTYHVVAGEIPLSKALELGGGTTLQGSKVGVRFADGFLKINDSNLVNADIKTANGVIHVIDSVLVPSLPETSAQSPVRVIELAIERGVHFFNAGDPGACAAIYEVTCEALLLMDGVSEKSRGDLSRILKSARAACSASDKAWILRDGLNLALARLHLGKVEKPKC
jgi:transforming growth factor-beta-induced protein